jgi:hypothetical protein
MDSRMICDSRALGTPAEIASTISCETRSDIYATTLIAACKFEKSPTAQFDDVSGF